MLLVLIIALLLINNAQNARILGVFPSPSLSHHVVFRTLTQELARRGHEVVVITPIPAFPGGRAPNNLKEIDVGNATRSTWKEIFQNADQKVKEDYFTIHNILLKGFVVMCENYIQVDDVQKLLTDGKKFDLLITESLFRSALMFSHVYKVPIIHVSSYGSIFNYEIIGSPSYSLLYPSPHALKTFNMSILDKLVEFYKRQKLFSMFVSNEDEENDMMRRVFGGNAPIMSHIYDDIQMVFLNIDKHWELNRPVSLNTVLLGRLHLEGVDYDKLRLPKDLQSYLDSSKNGVIYVSFGTNVNAADLPPEKVKTFLTVFSQLPYNVLWKWDKDTLPEKPSNVKIAKWFPQADILRHPNIKLFITQGGLQSTDEAIAAGVPLIGFPMVFDQWSNVDKIVHFKIGLKLDMKSLIEHELRNAIDTVIGDASFRRNVIRLRELMQDQRQRPLERAVWWVEYVLKHAGATHLRAPAANMPWTQYFELELLLIVLFIFVLGIILVHYLTRCFTRHIRVCVRFSAFKY